MDERAYPRPPGTEDSVPHAPSVSVVVPVFNGARTLPNTLASLARQDLPNVEWIIIDDRSTDTSSRVAQKFLQDHPGRGRLITHTDNRGLSRTLNEGLLESKGDLVLVLHHDIELVGDDWISRAVLRINEDARTAVVTGYYGIPASDDLSLVKMAFGVLRRQFHFVESVSVEEVTFTEFKSDLFRRAAVERVGGFSERFRIVGEDLAVSFHLRKLGYRLLKDYGLKSVQRFSGEAETLGGNLVKSFRFGQAMGIILSQFGLYPTVGTRASAYSRSRSWHRASQPVVAAVALGLLVAFSITRYPWVGIALLAWIVGRYLYYVLHVHSDIRRLSSGAYAGMIATLATGLIGLASDITYPVGVLVGVIRSGSAKVV